MTSVLTAASGEFESEAELGDICEILDSERVPLNAEERRMRKGPYPYYGANGIQDYVDDYLFEGELILLAEDGGNFTEFATRPIAQWVDQRCWVNNHAHVLRAKDGVSNKWVFYCLVHKNILRNINGGTRAKLNQADLKEICIPLPPLSEQERIAEILGSVDDVIEQTRTQIAKLQDLKTATMNELLTKGIGHTEFKDTELGQIPKSWALNALGQFVVVQSGFAFESSEFRNSGIPIVRISNIADGEVNLDRCVYYQQAKGLDRYLVSQEDVLIAMSGATTGKTASYQLSSPAYLNQRVGRFQIKSGANMTASFLFAAVSSQKFLDKVLIDAIGGAQPNISSSQIESYRIAVPPLEEQLRIEEILLSLQKQIRSRDSSLRHFERLKKSLMQDLLTGKVRVAA